MITEQDYDTIRGYVERNEPVPVVEVQKLIAEVLRYYKLLDELAASTKLMKEQLNTISEAQRKVSEILKLGAYI